MNIRIENNTTYFPVFNPMKTEIKAELEKRGIEYKIIEGRDIPDDQPQFALLDGHLYRRGVSCVVSKANAEDLQLLIDRLHNPRKYGEVDA